MNRTLETLGNQLIRLADSSGIEPGSDEFAAMVKSRIIDPENAMMAAVLGHKNITKNSSIKPDIFVSSMDNRYVHFLFLKSLVKWAKRNKGMYITNAAEILDIRGDNTENMGAASYQLLESYGKECLEFGLPDFTEWLDGSDDRTRDGDSMWPQAMTSGNRMTIGGGTTGTKSANGSAHKFVLKQPSSDTHLGHAMS